MSADADGQHECCSRTHALHVWPSSLHLCSWLWRQRDAIGRIRGAIVELGAGGTAMPSVVARQICHADNKVIITEQRDRPDIYALIDRNLEANGLKSDASHLVVSPLDWRQPDYELLAHVLDGASVSLILAADCMYDDSVFEPFLAVVEAVLRSFGTHDAYCLLAFQERDANWSLSQPLAKHRLTMEPVLLDYHVECAKVGRMEAELNRRVVHLATLKLDRTN